MIKSRMFGAMCVAAGIMAGAVVCAPSATAEDTIWHIKAVHPKGYLLDIKAVDAEGKRYDVKAIQRDGNVHMLDVKTFVDGKEHPVKVVVSEDRYAPIRALDIHGQHLDIVAITPEGKSLEVKGVRRTGSIIHIKVIGIGGRFFGVKAIAPDGRLYDVKGVKMVKDNTELLIGAVKVHAHVKALPPTHAGSE